MNPSQRLSLDAEKERYDLHENSDTLGYRSFLNRLAEPLSQCLKLGNIGLDYGCGVLPLMEILFREKGLFMHSYDPFFFPEKQLLGKKYDFITCSETAEHFFEPRVEFEKLFSMLKPGGFLGIMTQFSPLRAEFANWYYAKDPTHVCFYSPATLQWIADFFGASVEIFPPSVAIFQEKGARRNLRL